MRFSPRLSLIALAAAALASCESPPPEFRIGLIGVFEGAMAHSSGIPARDGARMAVDEINARGGIVINGVTHRVRLIERETAPRPEAAAITARALINLDSVDVLVGPQTSALAVVAGAAAEASEVPMIAPMASNPAVTAGRRFVNRLAFVDAVQGTVLARFAYDSLQVRRAAVLHAAASAYSRDITRLFDSTFRSLGGRMVAIETFNSDDSSSHEPHLRRIMAGRPDAILLPNFVTHDSAQVRIARALGFRGTFLGSDAWDVLSMQRREDALGSIVVANWDRKLDREVARQFRAGWQQRYPESRPRATAAATYDAVYLLADAAQRTGTKSGAPLAAALRAERAYDGAFARYRFDGTGDPIRGAVLLEMDRDSTIVRAVIEPDR